MVVEEVFKIVNGDWLEFLNIRIIFIDGGMYRIFKFYDLILLKFEMSSEKYVKIVMV